VGGRLCAINVKVLLTVALCADFGRYVHQRNRWLDCVNYISSTTGIRDVTISGGDASLLSGEDLLFLGGQLLDVPHVQYGTLSVVADVH